MPLPMPKLNKIATANVSSNVSSSVPGGPSLAPKIPSKKVATNEPVDILSMDILQSLDTTPKPINKPSQSVKPEDDPFAPSAASFSDPFAASSSQPNISNQVTAFDDDPFATLTTRTDRASSLVYDTPPPAAAAAKPVDIWDAFSATPATNTTFAAQPAPLPSEPRIVAPYQAVQAKSDDWWASAAAVTGKIKIHGNNQISYQKKSL